MFYLVYLIYCYSIIEMFGTLYAKSVIHLLILWGCFSKKKKMPFAKKSLLLPWWMVFILKQNLVTINHYYLKIHWVIIASGNGLVPNRHQAISWSGDDSTFKPVEKYHQWFLSRVWYPDKFCEFRSHHSCTSHILIGLYRSWLISHDLRQ